MRLLTQDDRLDDLAERWYERWDLGSSMGRRKTTRIYEALSLAERLTPTLVEQIGVDLSWLTYDCDGCHEQVDRVVQVNGSELCKGCVIEAFKIIAGQQDSLENILDDLRNIPHAAEVDPDALGSIDYAIDCAIEELEELRQ